MDKDIYLTNEHLSHFQTTVLKNLKDETKGFGWISDHKCEFKDVIHTSVICVKHCKSQKST